MSKLRLHANVEVDFVNDERLLNLTPAQRWVYLCLWITAVRERRELLPERLCSARSLAIFGHFDRRLARRAVERAVHFGLVQKCTIDGAHFLRVCGVKAKNPGLRDWEPEPVPKCTTSPSHFLENGTITERNGTERRSSKAPPPPETGFENVDNPTASTPTHFENFLTGQFKMTWGRDATPQDHVNLLKLVRQYGTDRKRWQGAFEAVSEVGNQPTIRLLAGCLRAERASMPDQQTTTYTTPEPEEPAADTETIKSVVDNVMAQVGGRRGRNKAKPLGTKTGNSTG